jgi:hypothetical protein
MPIRRGLCAFVALFVLAACTSPSANHPTPSPQELEQATLADLRGAMATWHATPATITYRTSRQRPGMPVSAHQCLRAYVLVRSDLPMGLRICDPAGVVTLTLDPPARWRIDVTEAGETTTAIVVGNRGIVCGPSLGAGRSCKPRSVASITRTFPFHQLIAAAGATSHEADIDPGGPITVKTSTVAGTPVRCYRHGSGEASATWCVADGGALLSFVLRTIGRAPTIAEAERISDHVAADSFVMPT